jgi:hypothetical protein
MIAVLSFVLAVATSQPVHQIAARAPDGTRATIVYWLMPSPRDGEDAVGPVIGGGTLRLTSHAHSLSIPLSRIGAVSRGAYWTQFIVNPQMACYARPISFNRSANGHEEVTIRYAAVGKGCFARTAVVDAVTGRVILNQ